GRRLRLCGRHCELGHRRVAYRRANRHGTVVILHRASSDIPQVALDRAVSALAARAFVVQARSNTQVHLFRKAGDVRLTVRSDGKTVTFDFSDGVSESEANALADAIAKPKSGQYRCATCGSTVETGHVACAVCGTEVAR